MHQPSFTRAAGPLTAAGRVLAVLGAQMVYDHDEFFLQRIRDAQS
jgi:hypothetical protein